MTNCTCTCHGRVMYVWRGRSGGQAWPQGSEVKRSHTSCRLQADPLLTAVLIVHIHHGCQRGLQPPVSFTLNQMFHLASPRCRLDIKQSEWLQDWRASGSSSGGSDQRGPDSQCASNLATLKNTVVYEVTEGLTGYLLCDRFVLIMVRPEQMLSFSVPISNFFIMVTVTKISWFSKLS